MARSHSPRIVTDGLVFCIDAANSSKGYSLGQNYFPYSEEFTLESSGWVSNGPGIADWGGTGVVAKVTSNYGIAPDGTLTADRIQLDKGSGTENEDRSGIRYNLSMVGRILSYHIKFLDSTLITDFITDVYPQGSNFTYTTLDDGWYRVEISGSSSSTCRIQYVSVTTNNTLDALIWGAQLEDNITTATPYTKTIGISAPSAYDLVSGNHGSLNGGISISNNSFVFDGVDDYITFPLTGVSIDSGCTLECVSRRFSTPVGWRTYLNVKPNSETIPFFEFRTTDANLDVAANYFSTQITSTNYLTPTYTVNTTDFYHFTATYDGTSTLSFYVNGEYIGNNTGTPQFIIGNDPRLTIGRAYSDDRYTDISVPVCRLYNRSLTESEIQQNFNALRGRFSL